MSNVNIPLLRKCVEWVEEQDALPYKGNWRQELWVTTPERLREIASRFRATISGETTAAELEAKADCGTAYCVAGYIANEVLGVRAIGTDAASVASKALGLGVSDGFAAEHPLFDAGNDAADIRRIAEDIAGERL